MSLIRAEMADQIATITLDHDAKRNALSAALIQEMIAAFWDFQEEKARAVILRANPGVKVWSAGHDVTELPRSGLDPLAYRDPLEQVIRAIRAFPAPVLAMVEGSVWGGACEVALCCDMVVATPSSQFAITPARLGLPYNAAGILRVRTSVGFTLAKEMFFTAQPITAERALSVGAINHLVEPEKLEEFTRGLALQIARNAPLAIAATKETLRLLSEASALPPETFERLQDLRRTVYDSRDYHEGVEAFLAKRKPVFRGE